MKRILTYILAILITAGAADIAIAASSAATGEVTATQKKSSSKKKSTSTKKSTSSTSNRKSSDVKSEKKANNQKIKQTKEQIEANKKLISNRLNELNLVTADVEDKEKEVKALQTRIDSTNSAIAVVTDSITTITDDVARLRKSAAKSLREARANRQSMTPLAMIFSSETFNQAIKRVGYIKQLDKSRANKTKALRSNLTLLDQKKVKLDALKSAQDQSMAVLAAEQTTLEKRQDDMATVVAQLRKEGGALQKELATRQEHATQLDRELDRIIAYEEQKAAEAERKRIEAEKRKQEMAEKKRIEDEKKRQAEELKRQEEAEARAKKKAEQEAKAQAEAQAKAEKERVKQEEAQRKAEQQAQAQAKKEAEEKARTQERIKAEAERQAALAAKKKAEQEAKKAKEAEKKAKGKNKKSSKNKGDEAEVPAPVPKPEPKPTPQPAQEPVTVADFAEAKGTLMFPVAGKHTIVGRFGRSKHADLSLVEVDNSGIDVEVAKGSSARAVHAGTVSSIFHLDGYHNIVMVRHGEYLTVYANLGQLAVKKGDNVKAGQNIGTIFSDPDDNYLTILHFEVRHEREKLNPLDWIKQ